MRDCAALDSLRTPCSQLSSVQTNTSGYLQIGADLTLIFAGLKLQLFA